MRTRILAAAAVLCLPTGLSTAGVLAGSSSPAHHVNETTSTSSQAASERVEIRADQSKGEVLFIIDGKPVMILDADGLRVNGDVRYSGSIKDTGSGAGTGKSGHAP